MNLTALRGAFVLAPNLLDPEFPKGRLSKAENYLMKITKFFVLVVKYADVCSIQVPGENYFLLYISFV